MGALWGVTGVKLSCVEYLILRALEAALARGWGKIRGRGRVANAGRRAAFDILSFVETMRLLYVVFVASIAALLWAALGIARLVRGHQRGKQVGQPSLSLLKQPVDPAQPGSDDQ